MRKLPYDISGLWMIYGPTLRCGKTALLTAAALQVIEEGGRDIVSNFRIEGADEIAPGEVLLLDMNRRNTVFCIDELWTLIDSRSWSDNRFYNQVVLMSGKRRNAILGTSQIPGMVDLRFRDIANYRVQCTRSGPEHPPDSIRATIRCSIETPVKVGTEVVWRIKNYRFKVAEVADHYDTSEPIEANPRLYVVAMARRIKGTDKIPPLTFRVEEEDWNLYEELVNASTQRQRENKLRTYLGVPTHYRAEILDVLGL